MQPRSAVERLRDPTVGAVGLLLLLVVAVRAGLAPLQDNSFLTHLATGRLVLDTGSVPTTDPYSWTALGEPWTVQSWLASVLYAGVEDVAGFTGVRLLVAALAVGLAVALWKLTAAGEGLLGRVVAAGLVAVIGTDLWVERPYMFGAVGLALVLLAADGRLDPRWMVPVLWVWANTHGSFPFGIGVVVLLALGRWLDERARPAVELRALLWTGVGTLLAVLGPLGTRVLTFPVEALREREAFSEVREWQPLRLDSTSSKVFVVQVLVAAVALARVRRWRAVLPTLVFTVAALTSVRNVLQASIVLTPVVAQGLGSLGRLRADARPALARPVVHALGAVVLVAVVLGLQGDDTALQPYPREAVAWMDEQGLLGTEARLVTRDMVGNYLELAYGPDRVRVFVDDRVDMYPVEVMRWYFDLLARDGDHARVVAEADPTVILWDQRSPFGRWVAAAPGWEVVWRDRTWLVAVPADAASPR